MSPIAMRLVHALTDHPDVAFEVLRWLDDRVFGPWEETDKSDPTSSVLRWRPGRGDAAAVVVMRMPDGLWSYVFNCPDGQMAEHKAGFASREEAVAEVDGVLRATGMILCDQVQPPPAST